MPAKKISPIICMNVILTVNANMTLGGTTYSTFQHVHISFNQKNVKRSLMHLEQLDFYITNSNCLLNVPPPPKKKNPETCI
jgi:hypothetical protein